MMAQEKTASKAACVLASFELEVKLIQMIVELNKHCLKGSQVVVEIERKIGAAS